MISTQQYPLRLLWFVSRMGSLSVIGCMICYSNNLQNNCEKRGSFSIAPPHPCAISNPRQIRFGKKKHKRQGGKNTSRQEGGLGISHVNAARFTPCKTTRYCTSDGSLSLSTILAGGRLRSWRRVHHARHHDRGMAVFFRALTCALVEGNACANDARHTRKQTDMWKSFQHFLPLGREKQREKKQHSILCVFSLLCLSLPVFVVLKMWDERVRRVRERLQEKKLTFLRTGSTNSPPTPPSSYGRR